MEFKALVGYVPEKVSNGFDIIKAKGLECSFNYARIEDYKGDKPELQGTKFFKYELQVQGGTTEYIGRRLWKSFNLNEEDQQKKLYALLDDLTKRTFVNSDELMNIVEELVPHTVIVTAWGWKKEGQDEKQMHEIKLIKSEVQTTKRVEF